MFLQKIFQPILRERTSAPKTRPAAACASERIKLAKKIASGFLTLSSICGVGGQCDWAEVFLKKNAFSKKSSKSIYLHQNQSTFKNLGDCRKLPEIFYLFLTFPLFLWPFSKHPFINRNKLTLFLKYEIFFYSLLLIDCF